MRRRKTNSSHILFLLLLLPRIDHSNDIVACAFGMCERQLGATFDCCPVIGDAQLGNGVQKMVSRIQNTHVLRITKGAQTETHRLDKSECISCVYHIIQIGHTGSSEFPAKKVEVLDFGWSTEYQKLQITAVATATELSNRTVSIAHFVLHLDMRCKSKKFTISISLFRTQAFTIDGNTIAK